LRLPQMGQVSVKAILHSPFSSSHQKRHLATRIGVLPIWKSSTWRCHASGFQIAAALIRAPTCHFWQEHFGAGLGIVIGWHQS
jgi:hypothetical protein